MCASMGRFARTLLALERKGNKLSNRPAASSFFQTFRPVDLKSSTDLSDIPIYLTDL